MEPSNPLTPKKRQQGLDAGRRLNFVAADRGWLAIRPTLFNRVALKLSDIDTNSAGKGQTPRIVHVT